MTTDANVVATLNPGLSTRNLDSGIVKLPRHARGATQAKSGTRARACRAAQYNSGPVLMPASDAVGSRCACRASPALVRAGVERPDAARRLAEPFRVRARRFRGAASIGADLVEQVSIPVRPGAAQAERHGRVRLDHAGADPARRRRRARVRDAVPNKKTPQIPTRTTSRIRIRRSATRSLTPRSPTRTTRPTRTRRPTRRLTRRPTRRPTRPTKTRRTRAAPRDAAAGSGAGSRLCGGCDERQDDADR